MSQPHHVYTNTAGNYIYVAYTQVNLQATNATNKPGSSPQTTNAI